MNQMNGNNNNRRPSSNINRIQMVDNNKPSSTNSQHEELIKYILDSWNKVSQEADRNAVIYYHEEHHQNLKDFKPFDLESYWGRRIVQNRMQHAQHS